MKKYLTTATISTSLSDNMTDIQTNTDIVMNHVADTGEDRIQVNRVHITKGETISFSGQTILPDGTYLQTQLFADGKPETWWPTDKYVQAENGKREITVQLDERGASLTSDIEYLFIIWERETPLETATFPFDLTPPPDFTLPERK